MAPGRCGMPYDYYWRDYTGIIPKDAVKGGRDGNNKVTYIGQVSVKNHGIIPVAIYPGSTSVVAAIYGVYKVETYIKILCSSSTDRLKWILADAENFDTQTADFHLVRGGVERNIISYIGRINYQDETLVSKIRPLGAGKVNFYFPSRNEEKKIDSYQVLVFDCSE